MREQHFYLLPLPLEKISYQTISLVGFSRKAKCDPPSLASKMHVSDLRIICPTAVIARHGTMLPSRRDYKSWGHQCVE